MKENTVAKYSNLSANVQLVLLAFPRSYMVKSAFSKHRSNFNMKHADLQLQLKNL